MWSPHQLISHQMWLVTFLLYKMELSFRVDNTIGIVCVSSIISYFKASYWVIIIAKFSFTSEKYNSGLTIHKDFADIIVMWTHVLNIVLQCFLVLNPFPVLIIPSLAKCYFHLHSILTLFNLYWHSESSHLPLCNMYPYSLLPQ
jgi:hypothetical protein